jgi:hypothetical protein
MRLLQVPSKTDLESWVLDLAENFQLAMNLNNDVLGPGSE